MPSRPSLRGVRTFRVARPDGAEIHVEVEGRGRSTVVLCDGLACDGFAWKYLRPALAEHHPGRPLAVPRARRVAPAAARRRARPSRSSPTTSPRCSTPPGSAARSSAGTAWACSWRSSSTGSPGTHPGPGADLRAARATRSTPSTTPRSSAAPCPRCGGATERFPRLAAVLTRVGVRSGLAMEVAMSTRGQREPAPPRRPPALLRAHRADGPALLPAGDAGRRRARGRGPPPGGGRAHPGRRRGPRPLHPDLALAPDGPGDPLCRALPGPRWEPHRASGATGGSEPRCARLPAPPRPPGAPARPALDPRRRRASRSVLARLAAPS